MTRKNLIMHYSLFVAMVGIVAGGDAFSAVRIGNATKNQYYANQMAQYQAMNQVASTNDIAASSGNDSARDASSVGESQLESCQQIYPTGEFEIARPTAGLGMGGAKTCTAVVELRGYQMGQNGGDAVLARANIAAGTTIDCNISAFPETSYTLDAQRVVFPADAEPTVEDVVAVMNQEQKQNAGIKIAAAALVGAIGGNISGKNDIGKDGFIGTDKNKMQNTVIGALGGAAIGAGGAYAGKVGGDMIMSAGINAAAGGVVGNIMAAGDSVLRIEKCMGADGKETGKSCLWGYLVKGPVLTKGTAGELCVKEDCRQYYINLSDGETVMQCKENENCKKINDLVSIKITVAEDGKEKAYKLSDLDDKKLSDFINSNAISLKYIQEDNNQKIIVDSGTGDYYALISDAKKDEGPKTPVLLEDFEDSAFGKKSQDWYREKENKKANAIYHRNSNGSMGNKIEDASIEDFFPMYVDANDGGIIDLGNKARLKSTLVGAGAGGALGAFTAYEGAQSDIDDRWVSAVREYKDSLQKFYCVTGNRFLSYYNDVVIIPNVKE